jgi:lipopolysaccharide export system ATP-binding protein
MQNPSDLSGPPAIVATDLFKRYGERTVVDHVSMEVRRGEVVGLLGPNGAGKTTSFYMIMGLVKPDGGRVMLGEKDITRWSIHERARAGVGYLPQDASIFRKLTVQENLLAILQMMPLTPKQQKERCEELLHNFDLIDRRDSLGVSLSGGERRRAEIARTLATNPQFVLLDEPFTGIDPKQVQEIQYIVHHLKDLGIGILITDHNVYDTLDILDRGWVLNNGRIVAEGTPAELVADEQAREVYFGDRIEGRKVERPEAYRGV